MSPQREEEESAQLKEDETKSQTSTKTSRSVLYLDPLVQDKPPSPVFRQTGLDLDQRVPEQTNLKSKRRQYQSVPASPETRPACPIETV